MFHARLAGGTVDTEMGDFISFRLEIGVISRIDLTKDRGYWISNKNRRKQGKAIFAVCFFELVFG